MPAVLPSCPGGGSGSVEAQEGKIRGPSSCLQKGLSSHPPPAAQGDLLPPEAGPSQVGGSPPKAGEGWVGEFVCPPACPVGRPPVAGLFLSVWGLYALLPAGGLVKVAEPSSGTTGTARPEVGRPSLYV